MRLCSDIDICKWEPALYSGAAGSERYMCSGNGGSISGTQFSANDNEFLLTGVEPGFVLRCWNELAMIEFCCEIVEVQANGNLVVSSVRPGDITVLWSPGNYTNLNYAVISYSPMIEEMSYLLISKLQGVDSPDDIRDSRSMRHLCVYAVISSLYATLARTEEDELYWQKSDYYLKQFRAEHTRFVAEIDTDGDGEADKRISGNIVSLKRK